MIEIQFSGRRKVNVYLASGGCQVYRWVDVVGWVLDDHCATDAEVRALLRRVAKQLGAAADKLTDNEPSPGFYATQANAASGQ